MNKIFTHTLITLLALGCLTSSGCTKSKEEPKPVPRPPLPYKINLVWQHEPRGQCGFSLLVRNRE